MACGQTAILAQRIAEQSEEIKGLKGQIAAEDIQLSLLVAEITVVQGLLEKGLVRRPRLLALQRRAAEIKGSRSENAAKIARAKQNIGEARLRISELRTSMINEVVQQLRDVQTELFDLAERIRAAEDILRRTEIRAPLAGTVVGLKVHTTGGVIAPGEPLLDIVPSGDRLVIEAQVAPNDIDMVGRGLLARVRLTHFNRRSAARIEGRVVSVSADRMTEERTGRHYYLARVKLGKDPVEVLDDASL